MDFITVAEAQEFAELETTMARTQKAFFEFGDALMVIRDKRLYRASYPTFEEYCQRRWEMGRSYVNKLIAASEVVQDLGTTVPTLPTNEAQARPLACLPSETRREVWQEAVDTAPNGKLTAAHVERTVNRYASDTRPITADAATSAAKDNCQTPAYALSPLLPYLPHGAVIWEPAAGDGSLVKALEGRGYSVVSGDIKTGQDFFEYEPTNWDILLTNPPYSNNNKHEWLKRCYELGKPFALLMQVKALGAGRIQSLFRRHGVEIILMDKRVDFQTINTNFDKSNAWFATAWFTHGLDIGREITFAVINKKALP